MRNENRLELHKKLPRVEEMLGELEQLLGPVEETIIQKLEAPAYPVVFIMGCARSGSTLLMQYLADTGLFCYPSNLMSRFYYAPYIGARLHQLLIELDKKNEVFNTVSKSSKFTSTLGKTIGAASPHEFWYFWRRFFKFGDVQQLSEEELEQADVPTFLKELAAIQEVFHKPLLMKGMILNWNIPFLADIVPQAFFIHIKRETTFNAQSLLQSRQHFFGNMKEWYSFRPPNIKALLQLTPEEQVVAQVLHTNSAIESGLNSIADTRYHTIRYEDFCEAPAEIIKVILQKAGIAGKADGIAPIKNTNRKNIADPTWDKLIKAEKSFGKD